MFLCVVCHSFTTKKMNETIFSRLHSFDFHCVLCDYYFEIFMLRLFAYVGRRSAKGELVNSSTSVVVNDFLSSSSSSFSYCIYAVKKYFLCSFFSFAELTTTNLDARLWKNSHKNAFDAMDEKKFKRVIQHHQIPIVG